MADDGTQGTQGITQEQYDALVAEREALIAKRDEILTEAKRAKDKLKSFEGIDPNEYKSLKQKMAELETKQTAEKNGVTSQELERLRAEVRQHLETEYAPFKTQLDALAKENRALKLDNVVKTVMGKNGVRSERVDDLFRLTADQYDLTDDGKPMLRDKMGLPVETYVKEDLRKAYPEWFEGTGSSGGGATKSIAGGGGSTRVIAADDTAAFMANIEKIAKGEVQVR